MAAWSSPSGVVVDHCPRCGGSFFDAGEAARAIGATADPSTWPPEIFARAPVPSPLACPAGHGPMWSFALAWEGRALEVDACGVCHGLFLDRGEAEVLDDLTKHARAEGMQPGTSRGAVGQVATYLLQLAVMLPIEVYNPVRRKPVLIWTLVGLLPILFVASLVMIGAFGDQALRAVALVPALVPRGYVHTFVTYAFFHGGVVHLLGNLYFLWIFGDNVEDRLGRARFAVLYLVTSVVGGIAHFAGNLGSSMPMVGASGAIAGLMGAYLVLFPRVKLWVVLFFVRFKVRAVWYLALWFGLQFLSAVDKEGRVAWLAHVGGFAAGVVLGKLLDPGPRSAIQQG
jgi:membrane associated rhomboid family serine protease/Zn-finger nucleic acid-binding protein